MLLTLKPKRRATTLVQIANYADTHVAIFRQRVGHLGVGQNLTTGGPQILLLVSIYEGSLLGTYF